MSSWCLDSCLECGRVVEGQDYCSPECASPPQQDSDDEYDEDESPSYASWDRVSRWAQNVSPTPPLLPRVFTSPSKRILTPQYPTACITSDPPVLISLKPPSTPRAARATPTAAQSLAASACTSASSRPALRLTTAFPKGKLTDSESEPSPVWWITQEKGPDSSSTSPAQTAPRFFLTRRPPPPVRGRKPVPLRASLL